MTVSVSSSEVDILVPVYGAAEALERCLASVSRHGGPAGCGLVLVLDGPQDSAVEQVLARITAPHFDRPVEILRQPVRKGFAAAINAGIARTPGDVVLLNSDTEVGDGWLERLRDAAYSSTDIASITPFSNSATICSLPRWLEENAVPAGWSSDEFSALVERCSQRLRPAIPTAVGFCMYLKRGALDQIGGFDEDGFGLGYGEEVDWCFRATRLGWRHVLDDATFVFHAGQSSFGTLRDARVRRANRIIRRRYPELWSALAEWVRRDPLAAARQRVIDRLRPPPAADSRPGRILHLVHGWPPWNHAGTELYAARLSRWQAERRPTSALSRVEHRGRSLGDAIELFDHGVRVRLLVNNFIQRNPLSRAALQEPIFEREFARLLAQERPDVVHVHHLAGLCSTLPMIAKRQGIKLIYQIQDWWTVCARANLLDWQRRQCSGPGLGKCSRCLPLTGRLPWLANPLLHAWRRRLLRRALRSADAWIMGSRFIETSFCEFALLRPDDAVHVLPYGVDRAPTPPRPATADGPLRVGFVGSLLPHKGAHVAVSAFSSIPVQTAYLEIWGNESASPAYSAELRSLAGESVRFRGSFPEGAEAAVFAELDVLVVPSLALESYGLAPREAMAHGVYVLASRRGALSEITSDPRCGEGFDPENPAELRQRVLALADDRGWQSTQTPCRSLWPTFEEHAQAVEDVYERVLATHRRPDA